MKYLRTFESIKHDFWIINKDTYFGVKLYKIGMSVEEIEQWINDYYPPSKNTSNDFIIIKTNIWSWDDIDQLDYYKDHKPYSYKGKVTAYDEDIKKYEISKVVNNYNL